MEGAGELAPFGVLGAGVAAEHEVAAGLTGKKFQHARSACAAGGRFGVEAADPAFGAVLHGDVGTLRVGAGPDSLDVTEEEVGAELGKLRVLGGAEDAQNAVERVPALFFGDVREEALRQFRGRQGTGLAAGRERAVQRRSDAGLTGQSHSFGLSDRNPRGLGEALGVS